MALLEIIPRLPKVELHEHLDGGLRPQTVIELAGKLGIPLPSSVPAELASWFLRGADRKCLSLYLEGFELTVSLLQTEAALRRVAREAVEDLSATGVAYAEIRFAPILHTRKALSPAAIVEAVLSGLGEGRRKTGLSCGLILCAMRNFGSWHSLDTAKLAVEYRDRGVVGFDIAGVETGYPPREHLEAFRWLSDREFPFTIHAGEAAGPDYISEAVEICGARRIGHGTRLLEDLELENGDIRRMGRLASFIRASSVPLECCLSSNLQTGVTSSLGNHPFGLFRRNGFRAILCSDNRLMSGTDPCRETALAVDAFGLGLDDLEAIALDAAESAFLSERERQLLIEQKIRPGYAAARIQQAGSI